MYARHCSFEKVLSVFAILAQSFPTVLAAALRKAALNFANTISMGLRSGL